MQEHQELKEVLSDLNGMSIEKSGEAEFDAKVNQAMNVSEQGGLGGEGGRPTRAAPERGRQQVWCCTGMVSSAAMTLQRTAAERQGQ